MKRRFSAIESTFAHILLRSPILFIIRKRGKVGVQRKIYDDKQENIDDAFILSFLRKKKKYF